MAWPIGLSWTHTHYEITTNPDKTFATMRVQGGPFYFNPLIHIPILNLTWYVYFGFRPTATWSSGYGDEGWLAPIARLMKKWGVGNFGIARRTVKI